MLWDDIDLMHQPGLDFVRVVKFDREEGEHVGKEMLAITIPWQMFGPHPAPNNRILCIPLASVERVIQERRNVDRLLDSLFAGMDEEAL